MKILYRLVFVAAAFFGAAGRSDASPRSRAVSLSEEHQVQLSAGEQVLVTNERETSFYPDIRVYQVVEGTPEEAMAVFADMGVRKDYQPYVVGTEILEGAGEPNTLVMWDLNVPTLGRKNAVYRQELSSTGCKFQLHVRAVKPPVGFESEDSTMSLEHAMLKGADGKFRMATLATYAARVDPSWWMRVVHPRSSHFKAYQAMVMAFSKQVSQERAEKTQLLEAQVRTLRKTIPQTCAAKIVSK